MEEVAAPVGVRFAVLDLPMLARQLSRVGIDFGTATTTISATAGVAVATGVADTVAALCDGGLLVEAVGKREIDRSACSCSKRMRRCLCLRALCLTMAC